MKKIKTILVIIAVILFLVNYQICEFFYPNDIKKWWALKINNYAVVLALTFISYGINTKGILKLILNISAGLMISSVIDKVWFNVREFRYNDIIMIILTICFSVLDYLKVLKNDAKNK